jgi:hypothetical protein
MSQAGVQTRADGSKVGFNRLGNLTFYEGQLQSSFRGLSL